MNEDEQYCNRQHHAAYDQQALFGGKTREEFL
jgi:hypothetical protein